MKIVVTMVMELVKMSQKHTDPEMQQNLCITATQK